MVARMREITLIWLLSISFCSAVRRNVVKTLKVDNGGDWGTWHKAEFCPLGEFAYGYKMKIEKGLGADNDDTSLNAIQLSCSGSNDTKITSGTGPWGDWSTSVTQCRHDEYFVAFSLQVESFQGKGQLKDDTAANFVKFLCREIFEINTEVKAESPGKGQRGEYGDWSLACDQGSAICGLETRVEEPQGFNTDDTALNDVRFFCCDN